MDKGYMIITRRLSPPTDNSIEHIYRGRSLQRKGIINLIHNSKGDARKYWYNITHLKLTDDKLRIEDYVKTYDQIMNSNIGPSCMTIFLNNKIKKGLINLLKQE